MTTIDAAIIDLLAKSKPEAAEAIKGAASDAVALSAVYFDTEYSAEEKGAIAEHAKAFSTAASPEMAARLNVLLASRAVLAGFKPSVADVVALRALAPLVRSWTAAERTGEEGRHHVVRFVDFVQNGPAYGPLALGDDKVAIDVDDVLVPIKPIDMKAEKERKKKEKEAAAAAAEAGAPAAATPAAAAAAVKEAVVQAAEKLEKAVIGDDKAEKPQKKEKKKKEKKPAPPPAPEKPLGPAMIDLRVGHILKAINHPNADSLYVSTMDCGDAPGTDNTSFSEEFQKTVRTVCSGLNGLVPLEEMQGRKIIAVCNLKPVTMRGVKSCAMVLAASPRNEEEDRRVELVSPPEGSVAGERVYFEGWQGEPEGVLNPKRKIWEAVQPGFLTTEGKEVAFDPSRTEAEAIQKQAADKPGLALLKTAKGVCTVKSLVDAAVR